MLDEMDVILAGLTRGFDLSILDRGYGDDDGRTLSWFREARVFGAVLPSNSPGVHSLWAPAVALKTPIALKPGREEPWTPLRIIESLAAAGFPREAFGFYPTDHGGAGALLQAVDRSMLFGDASTTKAWSNDPRVELHGPGYSKVILGDDAADEWEKYIDLMVNSISANGGRSCINASAVWTPKNADAIAEALAKRLAPVKALPADDPNAHAGGVRQPADGHAHQPGHRRRPGGARRHRPDRTTSRLGPARHPGPARLAAADDHPLRPRPPAGQQGIPVPLRLGDRVPDRRRSPKPSAPRWSRRSSPRTRTSAGR